MASKREFLKERFNRWLDTNRGEAVVAVSPENVLHTSGAYIVSQRMIRERLAITIFPLEGEPTFLVADSVFRPAKLDSWIEDTRAYAEHHDTPMRGLAEVLQEKGLAQARIALETRYLPAHSYLELGRELPNASFFDAAEVLNQTRMIKSQDEIDLMRRIALAAEKAIEYGFLFSRPGDTELEVVERMQRALHDLGGEWNPFVTLAAGAENTTKKHYSASAKPIRPGDIIHVDMVGFWQGYYTDFARMGVVQNPEDGQREAYRRVIDVQRHVMEVARPGVHACDLYESCAEYSRQIGMPFNMNIIGHSLGIGLHEYPILGPAYEQKLEANMMLCIEVGSEVPGLGRYHVEDLILISEDRNILLTDHMDTSEMTVVR